VSKDGGSWVWMPAKLRSSGVPDSEHIRIVFRTVGMGRARAKKLFKAPYRRSLPALLVGL